MQTFSYMRRNSSNYSTLTVVILFIIAVIYESISCIYPYFTPLLGIGFYYIVNNFHNEAKWTTILFIFLYSIYFEIDRGMFIFSYIIFFMLFYYFILSSIKESLSCKSCLVFIYVIVGYLGYYIMNLFLSYLFNMPLPQFSPLYFLFIISDIILVFALL
jgi:hypothetical protein